MLFKIIQIQNWRTKNNKDLAEKFENWNQNTQNPGLA